MLQKDPKPTFKRYIRRGAAALFVVESFIFAASYGLWYRLNTSRDFRLYMHNNHNWVLDSYYKIGETISSDSARARELDIIAWKQEGKLSPDI